MRAAAFGLDLEGVFGRIGGSLGGNGSLGDLKVQGVTLNLAGVQNYGNVLLGPDVATSFKVTIRDTFTMTVVSATGLVVGDSVTNNSTANGIITSISGTTIKLAVTSGTWGASGTLHDTTAAVTTTYSSGALTDGTIGLTAGDSVTTAQGNVTVTLVSNPRTTIASGSNGLNLPQATINVASAAAFPASGTAYVTTSSGIQAVAYTGKTGTTFTGCTGGVGTMATNNAVGNGYMLGDTVDNTAGATGLITSVVGSTVKITVTAGAWLTTGAIHDSTRTSPSTTYTGGPAAVGTGTIYSVVGHSATITPTGGTWPTNQSAINDSTTSTISYYQTLTQIVGTIAGLSNRGLHLKVKGNLTINNGNILAGQWGTGGAGGAGGAGASGLTAAPSNGSPGSPGAAGFGAAYSITAGGGGGSGGGAGSSGKQHTGGNVGAGGAGGVGGAGSNRGSSVDSLGSGAGGTPGGAGGLGTAGGPTPGANGANGTTATSLSSADPRPWRTDFDPPFELPRRFGPGAPGGGGAGGGGSPCGTNSNPVTAFGPGYAGGPGGLGGTGGGPLLVEISGNLVFGTPGGAISAAGGHGASGDRTQSAANSFTGGNGYGCGGEGGGSGGGGGGGGSALVVVGGTTTGAVVGTTVNANGGPGASGAVVNFGVGAGDAGVANGTQDAGQPGGNGGNGGSGEPGYAAIVTP